MVYEISSVMLINVIGFLSSYGAGLLGSLAYMRMLGNTVDSMADGAKGAKGLMK